MRYFLFLIILFSIDFPAQDKNKIIKDEETSEPMLIGYCSREVFNDSSFALWFNSAYEDYEPDSSSVELLQEKMEEIDITIVMGTWCDDSRIHIPHFYKILDEINYPTVEITLIAVNRDKKTESDEIVGTIPTSGGEGLAIDLVPTIILYINNSELGRIVEVPNQSIEEDMLNILTVSE